MRADADEIRTYYTTPEERAAIMKSVHLWLDDDVSVDYDRISAVYGRDIKTIVRIQERSERDELFMQWRPSHRRGSCAHHPLRVARKFYNDARDGKIHLTATERANALSLSRRRLRRVEKRIAQLDRVQLSFSRGALDIFHAKYLDHLALAKDFVLMEMYSLTEDDIVDMLCMLATSSPRVKVFVILDQKLAHIVSGRSAIERMLNAGINIAYNAKKSHSQHQKMTIVDNILYVLGSANDSKNGMKYSWENLTYHYLFELVDVAIKEFQAEWLLSTILTRETLREWDWKKPCVFSSAYEPYDPYEPNPYSSWNDNDWFDYIEADPDLVNVLLHMLEE